MPLIKKYLEDFTIENNQIKLTENYLKNNKFRFKKITGSRMASVLGLNEFSTPLKTWAMMVGIYTEPMDEMIARAGNVIEPKIKDYVEQVTHIKYKQYVPTQVKFDIFSDNKVFGGIPDGEPVDENGALDYHNKPMLEIKTSSIDAFLYKKENNLFVLQKDENNHPIIKSVGTKREKWFDSNKNVLIPTEYKFQLGLYCYLRKITKGIFAVCFLEHKDYINPEACNVFEREIQLVDFNVDLEKFNYWISSAKKWYSDYIETGISPKMTLEDEKWLKTELELIKGK